MLRGDVDDQGILGPGTTINDIAAFADVERDRIVTAAAINRVATGAAVDDVVALIGEIDHDVSGRDGGRAIRIAGIRVLIRHSCRDSKREIRATLRRADGKTFQTVAIGGHRKRVGAVRIWGQRGAINDQGNVTRDIADRNAEGFRTIGIQEVAVLVPQ